MNRKYWCLECGAYAETQCHTAGHISEEMRLVANKWTLRKPRKFTIASPPESGRGMVEHRPCTITGTANKVGAK